MGRSFSATRRMTVGTLNVDRLRRAWATMVSTDNRAPLAGTTAAPTTCPRTGCGRATTKLCSDFRHRIQHGLDLRRRHVGSRGLDESACAAGEVQMAGVVEPSPVPGGVPAVGAEHLVAFLFVDTVHYDLTANLDLAVLTGGRLDARGGVDDPVLHHTR